MNCVILIGRLTKDPQIRYGAETQMAVARFTLAIDRESKNKATDFPNIVCFGKVAENVEKYVHKGDLVGVSGNLQTTTYEKDGKTRYTTEVAANRVEFLNLKGAKEEPKEEPKENPTSAFAEITDEIPF